jgi:CPA2 family monovalent cation:H+ antiporter-2
MVVGIERDQKRMINPDTDLELRGDDIIWVVGEESKLAQLFSEMG